MLRIVFMGTPAFSVPTLVALQTAGHEVVAVYTQPPRPAGRGMAETRSPVHMRAASAGLRVETPRSLRGAPEQETFASLGADIAVVVAYGLILPPPVLAAPRQGCLNIHASALPRWRGAAPIQRAIMAGDRETAVGIMRMEEGLDTGPVCLTQPVAIGPDMTAGELHDVLMDGGARLIIEALARLEAGSLDCTPQPSDGITYASKIDKSESRIDFTRSADEVANHIRGLSPFPGAWLEVAGRGGRPERIKVLHATRAEGRGQPGEIIATPLRIACREGAVELASVQRAGKRPMSAADLLAGFPLEPGARAL